jgi:hypothetical protein
MLACLLLSSKQTGLGPIDGGISMRTKTLLLAAAALGLSGAFGAANAVPLSGSFTVNAWTGACSDATCAPGSASEQAVPTNPLITTGTHELTNASATGNLQLAVPASGANTYFQFFNNNAGAGDPANSAPAGAGLTFTTPLLSTTAPGNVVMSTGTYDGTAHAQTSTLMKFVFTLPAGSTVLTILHDDGISLFNEAALGTDLVPTGHSAPTHSQTDTTAGLGAGTYDLWYSEVNGAPAQLDVSFTFTPPPPPPVAEPTSLALFGTGLIALGLLRRRRKAA